MTTKRTGTRACMRVQPGGKTFTQISKFTG